MHSRKAMLVLVALALLVSVGAAGPSGGGPAVTVPPERSLYVDGPSGRYLLNGAWLLRKDPSNRGIGARWFAGSGAAGWRSVSVPNAWNAGDNSVQSDRGGTVWYRKDFKLPDASAGLTWLVHFDSVNYRATVWLNGQQIGSRAEPYLPFELVLCGIHAGVNRLVVRVDNRSRPTDLGQGGWWNYGGITRDVYLRRVDRIDFAGVQIRPTLPCQTCDATIDYAVTLRNYSAEAQPVHLTGAYGGEPIDLGSATIAPGATQQYSASLPLAHPHLWSPLDPYLYTATLDASIGSSAVSHYTLLSGVRSIGVSSDGRLLLNGRFADFRGVNIHESSAQRGNALTIADRDRIFGWIRQLGAIEIRSHYPLSPYMYEQADRLGILAWSEVPVYRVRDPILANPSVQQAGLTMLRDNIAANGNHPSIVFWSVGNELNETAPAHERGWIARAAAAAKTADPTRLTTYSIAGRPRFGCGSQYAPLDVIGLSDYFGWYGGSLAHRSGLSPFLNKVRACQPSKAIVVTEFGAEASQRGPASQKGTYAFQQNFVKYHLGVFATKPWLSGASYFSLQEFRVVPGWTGGNPHPDPPWHQKGLISFSGFFKPAFFTAAQLYHQTQQYPAP